MKMTSNIKTTSKEEIGLLLTHPTTLMEKGVIAEKSRKEWDIYMRTKTSLGLKFFLNTNFNLKLC